MKQLPITFREIYSNEECGNSEESVYYGFEPYTTTDERIRVLKRAVEITPMYWNRGAMLRFRILNYQHSGGHTDWYWKTIHEFYIHDVESEDSWYHPTADQGQMMKLLASGDLRSKAAEDAVHSLYYNLVIMNKKCDFEKYLPLVVEKYK